jgi:hypothetical protein
MFLKLIAAWKTEKQKIEKLLDESSKKGFLFITGGFVKVSE